MASSFVQGMKLVEDIETSLVSYFSMHCLFSLLDGEEMSDAIHVLVGAPYYRLVGLVALVNSIYQNTNATVKFHLITDAEGMSHLSQWLDVPTLWKVRRDIIVFNEQWIKGKLNISRYERGRGKEFMDPVCQLEL